jgi:hypothetical protein
MAEVALLDRAYHYTMQRFISTGQAPHYSGIPAWLHPQTDYLVSFAPFHSLPTQYRISVDGQQRWFAQ